MKRLKLFLLVPLLWSATAMAQNTYIDITTTAALKLYADNLKKEQNKTIDQQTKLQEAQTFVATQMAAANAIQNKILRGLSEVSKTVQNGIQLQQILSNATDCTRYGDQILSLVKDDPEFAVFGKNASQVAFDKTLQVYTDAYDIIASGDLNLATAGDRYRLLDHINDGIIKVKLSLIGVVINLQRAKRLGFWKSLNPFQGYINTDKSIVQGIMDKYKYNF